MENLEQITIFYLPTSLRRISYPPLEKDTGKWWHTGIIYKNRVYECFGKKKNSITNLKDRKSVLDNLGAVYYLYYISNVEEKIKNNINKGYSCDNFVEAVLEKHLNTDPSVINHFEK